MRYLLFTFIFCSFASQVLRAQPVIESADDISVIISDPSKVITLGGTITETVYTLGFGDNVVATDQSSTYPPEVFRKPRVPYVRNLTAEGILSVGSTLILASSDASPQTAIRQIRDAGTPVLLIPEEESLEGAITKLEIIGKVFGAEREASQLIEKNKKQIQAADSIRATLTSTPSVMFILASRTENNFMVAGNNTGAKAMIELAGAKNAFDSFEGYKTVSNEAIAAANPDYVLVMNSRMEEIKSGLNSTPGINLITAVQQNQIIDMDGNYLLGFGPRFGSAVLTLMQLLHPGKSIEL